MQEQPLLTRATFYSKTIEEKECRTGIFVEVRTADSATLLAHAFNVDCSSHFLTCYEPGTEHQFDLNIDCREATKLTCQEYCVRVSQCTEEDTTWKLDGRVVLFFSNGTTLTAEKNDITLVNDGALESFEARIGVSVAEVAQ